MDDMTQDLGLVNSVCEQLHIGNSTLSGSWKLSKFSWTEETGKGIPRKEKGMLKCTEFQKWEMEDTLGWREYSKYNQESRLTLNCEGLQMSAELFFFDF